MRLLVKSLLWKSVMGHFYGELKNKMIKIKNKVKKMNKKRIRKKKKKQNKKLFLSVKKKIHIRNRSCLKET